MTREVGGGEQLGEALGPGAPPSEKRWPSLSVTRFFATLNQPTFAPFLHIRIYTSPKLVTATEDEECRHREEGVGELEAAGP
jgi:hypothetical protein